MTEVLFYQLDRRPLESVLVSLLEKSLERGWRAVVQISDNERVDALDAHLWTYRDESFLAHGTAATGHSQHQPVYLTDAADNPNGAQIRFFVDGAEPQDVSEYERAVYLFDGRDDQQKQVARGHWAALRDAGHEVTYWLQDDDGRWRKQA